MKNQFVPYELAVKLKELGFDEECFCTYHNGELSRNPSHSMDAKPIQKEPYIWKNNLVHNTVICAPLWQQAFDWFRGKHGIDSYIAKVWVTYSVFISKWDYENHKGNVDLSEGVTLKNFHDYNKAKQACLEKLIELCQK